jgi:CHAT domain-containing protein
VSPDSESDGYKVLGLTLHEWLIGSFEDALVEAAVTQLVFVTTELVGVPFAALPGRDGFLVERFAVSIVPFVERARPPRAG